MKLISMTLNRERVMSEAKKQTDWPDRPRSLALLNAIEKAISDIADNELTPIEVLGCLDLAARNFHESWINDEC